MSRKARLTTLSLFSGVGGLDFGFEAAGFETSAAVEFDGPCCKTLRANRPSWSVIEGDIHEVTSKEILEKAGVRSGDLDVLIGGPPCQPFSKSSYWAKGGSLRLDDPRADTLTAYLRVLRDTRPRAFLLENVYGLVYKGKDEGLQHLISGIDQINRETGTNYSIKWKMLNACHYGVPQARERVFLVGSRDGKEFLFPPQTHHDSESPDLFSECEPYRTAWDAIGDLPPHPENEQLDVGGKWADLLPSIPEGQNYLWHTARGGGLPLFGWRKRYWSFLLKLAKKRPSWTIQAQPGSSVGPFHWNNRRLSVREMCRLQTIPDSVTLDCSRTNAQKMLGNAVPSLLAEVLAIEIKTQLLDGKRSKPTLTPAARENTPPPEPVLSVPRKYLKAG